MVKKDSGSRPSDHLPVHCTVWKNSDIKKISIKRFPASVFLLGGGAEGATYVLKVRLSWFRAMESAQGII